MFVATFLRTLVYFIRPLLFLSAVAFLALKTSKGMRGVVTRRFDE